MMKRMLEGPGFEVLSGGFPFYNFVVVFVAWIVNVVAKITQD